jgi:hypothetical protein
MSRNKRTASVWPRKAEIKSSPDAARSMIEHVVVLMLENRSFDHMLGLLTNRQMDGLLGTDGVTLNPAFTPTLSRRISSSVTRPRNGARSPGLDSKSCRYSKSGRTSR